MVKILLGTLEFYIRVLEDREGFSVSFTEVFPMVTIITTRKWTMIQSRYTTREDFWCSAYLRCCLGHPHLFFM